MVKETPIIVADEPTGNLDEASAKDVFQILKKVAKDKLVILVTHNIEQVEEYASRIVKMHDGRIIENIEIKKIQETPKPIEKKENKIRLTSKYRLGIRNTFNILTKFLLLFAVFLFITSALFAEYAGFMQTEKELAGSGNSPGFRDLSENRILMKKSDKTYFTDEDYNKIKKLENTDYIIKDDIFLDTTITLYKDNMHISGDMKDIEKLSESLDLGRMPENKNEIVININKENFYITNRLNDLLTKEFEITGTKKGEEIETVNIVGIKYKEKNDYNTTLYAKPELMSDLRAMVNYLNGKGATTTKVILNNQYNTYCIVIPSSKVEKGTAIIADDLKYNFPNGNIRNKEAKIEVETIYYKDEINLKISKTYTKANFKKLTGYDNYDSYRTAIFANPEDYNSLYDKPPYQSSLFIKDVKNIDKTMQELEGLGIKAKKVTDYKVNHDQMGVQVLKIVKVIVTAMLIFVLFFISYFVIRIIIKSRNVYYTTLRMLGATYKSIKRILDIELFIDSSLAYAFVVGFISLVKVNIIHLQYVLNLSKFIGIREYILIYVIIALMSRIISRRFSRKIFKETAIKTYNEEV
ncbi:MAG: hypothetical protein HFJ51_05815 [Clostridia bacterium]|nr:hypothetical protein [Clostridia bacterium]